MKNPSRMVSEKHAKRDITGVLVHPLPVLSLPINCLAASAQRRKGILMISFVLSSLLIIPFSQEGYEFQTAGKLNKKPM